MAIEHIGGDPKDIHADYMKRRKCEKRKDILINIAALCFGFGVIVVFLLVCVWITS